MKIRFGILLLLIVGLNIGSFSQIESPWGEIRSSAINHSVLVSEKFGGSIIINGEKIEEGDWIGVFYEDPKSTDLICAGAGQWVESEKGAGFPAFGDEEETDEIEGFKEGDTFYFKTYKTSTSTFCNEVTVVYHDKHPFNANTWIKDGLVAVIELKATCK